MKNKKFTAFVLAVILTVSFASIAPLQKVSADETTSTGYSTFAQSYFHNLNYNYGNNQKGSCGYVAMGMLLSYYDTFLNDSIIPEQYDQNSVNFSINLWNPSKNYNMAERGNSPGILWESLPDGSPEEYLNAINSVKDVSLHAKLISIGAEQNLYNRVPNDGYYCALSNSEEVDILDYYIQNVLEWESNTYSIEAIIKSTSVSSENVKSWALNKINNGIPVMLSVRTEQDENGESRGHAVVAYDSDSEGNIYCHWGHDGVANFTRTTPESEDYVYYSGAIAINWNIPHSCSNNYVVQTYNDENEVVSSYYCYEHKDIITYDHVCDFSYSVEQFDSTHENYRYSHIGHCHCTESNIVSHDFLTSDTCSLCGLQCEHSYSYTCLNDLRHRGVCRYCTHIKISPHVFRVGSRTCLECYAIIADGLIVYPNSAPIAYSINGSYVMGNGCIVLVPEDEASYFNGTLIFYKAGEVPEVM